MACFCLLHSGYDTGSDIRIHYENDTTLLGLSYVIRKDLL